MRLKDGKQQCPKCGGEKCYWCRRTGYVVQCPTCCTSEHELITKDGNEFRCAACGSRFDASGRSAQEQGTMPS